jgi:hypothetical protein
LGTNPASTSFVQVKKDIAAPFAIANNIQFFGQNTTDGVQLHRIQCGAVKFTALMLQ